MSKSFNEYETYQDENGFTQVQPLSPITTPIPVSDVTLSEIQGRLHNYLITNKNLSTKDLSLLNVIKGTINNYAPNLK